LIVGPSKCPYSMQNKHIEHPEDFILTGDLSVLDWFCEDDSYVSLKIDGAPAIVWGINPATNQFFVGTKSVFNKKLIKINETHDDIDQNHSGNVANILHHCFDYLPRINGIIQGDFIGFGGSDTFQPNTITYKFPETITQNIIIAPHTFYTAEHDLRDAIAQPLKFTITDTMYCKIVHPDAWILDDIDLHKSARFARQMSTLVEFATPKQLPLIKKVLNTYFKIGAEIDEDEIAYIAQCDVNLIRLWKLVRSIKQDMLYMCQNDSDMQCEINDEEVDHEGYVCTNQFGTYKLVDREVFSRQNFINDKVWAP